MVSFIGDDEVFRKRNDLEMMRRPHLWPSPLLHLKNYALTEAGGFPLFAVLSWNKEKGFHFLLEEEKEGRHGDESLLAELIKEGWLVD
jgi:hypothetical protein